MNRLFVISLATLVLQGCGFSDYLAQRELQGKCNDALAEVVDARGYMIPGSEFPPACLEAQASFNAYAAAHRDPNYNPGWQDVTIYNPRGPDTHYSVLVTP